MKAKSVEVEIVINSRELATILHGLRLVAEAQSGARWYGSCSWRMCQHFDDHKILSPGQINELCEQLNTAIETKKR